MTLDDNTSEDNIRRTSTDSSVQRDLIPHRVDREVDINDGNQQTGGQTANRQSIDSNANPEPQQPPVVDNENREAPEQQQQQQHPEVDNGIEPNAAEPDRCPVCHEQQMRWPARPNVCQHMHCLQCLRLWSRNHNTCAVCRQEYQSILYNIVDAEHFHEIRLPEGGNQMMAGAGGGGGIMNDWIQRLAAPEPPQRPRRRQRRIVIRRRMARANRYEREAARINREADAFDRRRQHYERLAIRAGHQAEVRRRRAQRRRLFAARIRRREA